MSDFLAETLASDEVLIKSGRTQTLYWERPAPGVILLAPHQKCDKSVVISAAIHGNETAPVEILDELVKAILLGKYPLKVRLLVILGNIEAMRRGERYLNIDLNRLFSDHYKNHEDCSETQRAALLQQLVGDFYMAQPAQERLHFDLHTAIRASHHSAFALLPYIESGRYDKSMIAWLENAGLDALVVNHAPAATFSYFTSNLFAAHSCTLELGKAKPFAKNNLQQFAGMKDALVNLIRAQKMVDETKSVLAVYQVAEVIIKLSDQFKLNFSHDVKNFSVFPKGFILASDGDFQYSVQEENGYILFPNNDVKIGFRAGLSLVKTDLSAIVF